MILFNIIILLLIAHLFVQFLFKPVNDTLNCGLYAWSSTKASNWTPLKKFKFELLGVEMDSRGGDGCGVAFDNNVIKSVELKKFDDFWRKNHVPDKLKTPMIIGHDRKASVGEKTIQNTQPISFELKDKTVEGILAHNGTIYNYKELYEKHKLEVHYEETDIKTMSDSQVLALLLERVGWSILEEYTGSVAMMFMSAKTPNEFYIYHGESPMRKFAISTEERPMFYAIDGEDLWLCSTRSALEKIIADKTLIREVPFNTVFSIKGNVMTEVIKIDRSKAFQWDDSRSTTTVVHHASGNYAGGRSSLYEQYDSSDDIYDGDGYVRRGADYYNGRFLPSTGAKARDIKLSEDLAYGKYQDTVFWESGFFRVVPTPNPKYNDKGNVLHGLIAMSSVGKLFNSAPDATKTSALNLYFWYGNLVKGREEFQDCLMIEKEFGLVASRKQITKMVAKNFALPFIIPNVDGGDDEIVYSNFIMTKVLINGKSVDYCNDKYTGYICPIGRSQKLHFKAGVLTSVCQETYTGIYAFKKYSDPYPEEFAEWMYEFDSGSLDEDDEWEYVCPDCQGGGEAADGSNCILCGGTGYINKDQVEDELLCIREDVDIMSIQTEEMKYLTVIRDVVENGIELLEEPDMVEKTSYALSKLIKIKEIINE